MNYAKRLWGYTLEILFPPLCLKCRAYITGDVERENLLCKQCFDTIRVYKTVAYSPGLTLAAAGTYEDEALRALIHAYKYDRAIAAEATIEKIIHKYLDGFDLARALQGNAVIVPIPLHRNRLRQRGFNQADFIADILSERLGAPVFKEAIKRIKDTPHQTTTRSKEERARSLSHSFELNEDSIKGKSVILVDDVYTSGATMNEAAKTLKKGGAKTILGFVVAKTG